MEFSHPFHVIKCEFIIGITYRSLRENDGEKNVGDCDIWENSIKILRYKVWRMNRYLSMIPTPSGVFFLLQGSSWFFIESSIKLHTLPMNLHVSPINQELQRIPTEFPLFNFEFVTAFPEINQIVIKLGGVKPETALKKRSTTFSAGVFLLTFALHFIQIEWNHFSICFMDREWKKGSLRLPSSCLFHRRRLLLRHACLLDATKLMLRVDLTQPPCALSSPSQSSNEINIGVVMRVGEKRERMRINWKSFFLPPSQTPLKF
jgi:hypothetical protein